VQRNRETCGRLGRPIKTKPKPKPTDLGEAGARVGLGVADGGRSGRGSVAGRSSAQVMVVVVVAGVLAVLARQKKVVEVEVAQQRLVVGVELGQRRTLAEADQVRLVHLFVSIHLFVSVFLSDLFASISFETIHFGNVR